tara:strand:- start:7091 stop:7324 length:234 start_codon:yes stop_codon:yes gene_type:complete
MGNNPSWSELVVMQLTTTCQFKSPYRTGEGQVSEHQVGNVDANDTKIVDFLIYWGLAKNKVDFFKLNFKYNFINRNV